MTGTVDTREPHATGDNLAQAGGLVTETHIGQRKISNEEKTFGLFLKRRFQFILSLRPTFACTGMIARNVLCPAKPKAQFALVITRR